MKIGIVISYKGKLLFLRMFDMEVLVQKWSKDTNWQSQGKLIDANLVIYFGGQGTLNSGERYRELRSFYPNAHIIGCSTGGEICGEDVNDNTVVASAVSFSKTQLKTFTKEIASIKDSFDSGVELANALKASDLVSIFVLSDGTNVNGSELVEGIYSVVGDKVTVTGGFAGDGADFGNTFVGLDCEPKPKQITAIGFYGDALKVGYGSVGGWSPFGPKRYITKSKHNVLQELDGKPALDLYKQYLGEEADKLPGSGLLFPLSIRPVNDMEHDIVRTVISVDEQNKTMTFAGDMPEGYIAQLMHANLNSLTEGAVQAAKLANSNEPGKDSLAILVSCIGRKLLLGQRTSDEVEAVGAAFNNQVPMIGFYSYGEICHQKVTNKCSFHNQTMTITLFHESE